MKALRLLSLATLASVASTTQFVIPEGETTNPSDEGFLSKFGILKNPKIEALKEAAQAATAVLEKNAERAKSQLLNEAHKLVEKAKGNLRVEYGLDDVESLDDKTDIEVENTDDYGGAMRVCDKSDCRNQYFMKETVRWIKQALLDMGVFVHENPKATMALFIGASVLIANLVTGGALVPMALHAIGFGTQGPTAGSLAALAQKHIGSVAVGSTFAQLQSAAMGGAAMVELQKIATVAFAGLGAIGATGLIGAGRKGLGQASAFGPDEWRKWEQVSRINVTNTGFGKKVMRSWGPLEAQGCVAYGFREYRAPIWFVPHGEDPVESCLRTPSMIEGIGFKMPLACADEGPKHGVIGTWYVQSREAQCMPRWSTIENEGCMQYGRRRKFARLLGLRRRDDWNGVCESTPAQIGGQDYEGPTYCEDKGILGVYGVFDMLDEKCECYCGGE